MRCIILCAQTINSSFKKKIIAKSLYHVNFEIQIWSSLYELRLRFVENKYIHINQLLRMRFLDLKLCKNLKNGILIS